jgi:hypothetical protein
VGESKVLKITTDSRARGRNSGTPHICAKLSLTYLFEFYFLQARAFVALLGILASFTTSIVPSTTRLSRIQSLAEIDFHSSNNNRTADNLLT